MCLIYIIYIFFSFFSVFIHKLINKDFNKEIINIPFLKSKIQINI